MFPTGEHLKNFEVIVGNQTEDPTGEECYLYEGVVGEGATVNITCEQTVIGRYVYIRKKEEGSLMLCEVSIFGYAGMLLY